MNYTYKEILTKAKACNKNVKKDYILGISSKWSYYFAKAIITPKKDIVRINFDKAPNPKGTLISRQISKTDYIQIAKDYVKFVEKHKRLPNYLLYANHKLKPRLLTEFFSRILIFHDKHDRYASRANINSKVFTKPSETGNVVYDYFVNKTGKKYKTIDDLLGYVQKNFNYQHYTDDHKSNKQVTDSKSGNCVDLLQWCMNMTKPMGYESRCIHVKCSSGEGHVFGQFKHSKHTGGNWITRDIAAVANGNSITSVWCKNGTRVGVNPSWFMENLNR